MLADVWRWTEKCGGYQVLPYSIQGQKQRGKTLIINNGSREGEKMVTTKVLVLHNSFLMGHWGTLFSYISSTSIKILNVVASRKTITVCLWKRGILKTLWSWYVNLHLSSTSCLQMKGCITKPGKAKVERTKRFFSFFLSETSFPSLILNAHMTTWESCTHFVFLEANIHFHSRHKMKALSIPFLSCFWESWLQLTW